VRTHAVRHPPPDQASTLFTLPSHTPHTTPPPPGTASTHTHDSHHLHYGNEAALGKLAASTAQALARIGWRDLVLSQRGPSHLAANLETLPHKAGRLLHHLQARGAAVPLASSPWPLSQRDRSAARGPHQSVHDHRDFVAAEMLDFCRQGYWLVLPYASVRTWDNLRLSPLGVVPQRERRPRLIVDYTWSGLNDDTLRLAPAEAMQFGRTLQRTLTHIVHADPRFGPPKLAKLDIADGFYRVNLNIVDIPKLAVILPPCNGVPLVALPLSLPMGWVESPPYFTALTETACDLANSAMRYSTPSLTTPHRLEPDANIPPPNWTPRASQSTGDPPIPLCSIVQVPTHWRPPHPLRPPMFMLTILSLWRKHEGSKLACCAKRSTLSM
jgi:hypothetical protein